MGTKKKLNRYERKQLKKQKRKERLARQAQKREKKNLRTKNNKHHMKPKSRGGNASQNNLLLIDIQKHKLLHEIFGNKTLVEILTLLIRTARAKGYESIEPAIEKFYSLID